jgi:hypothetical protein
MFKNFLIYLLALLPPLQLLPLPSVVPTAYAHPKYKRCRSRFEVRGW